MTINSMMISATQGMQNGFNRIAVHTTQASSGTADTPTEQINNAMVGMHEDAINIRASLSVVKTADAILGTLVDLRA